ncbi:uncharacterized protein [Miscanthus floridulus]|uniref:uncharacterized protein n=1 Tax=Miscanthus floridulus TaxID=154761 RepID=UPI003458BCFD
MAYSAAFPAAQLVAWPSHTPPALAQSAPRHSTSSLRAAQCARPAPLAQLARLPPSRSPLALAQLAARSAQRCCPARLRPHPLAPARFARASVWPIPRTAAARLGFARRTRRPPPSPSHCTTGPASQLAPLVSARPHAFSSPSLRCRSRMSAPRLSSSLSFLPRVSFLSLPADGARPIGRPPAPTQGRRPNPTACPAHLPSTPRPIPPIKPWTEPSPLPFLCSPFQSPPPPVNSPLPSANAVAEATRSTAVVHRAHRFRSNRVLPWIDRVSCSPAPFLLYPDRHRRRIISLEPPRTPRSLLPDSR